MASEDNKFVTQVMEGQLYKRVERLGRESLSGPARTAFLLWRTRELVGDGGVAHFHQGNLDVSAVVDAFQKLGFAEAAQALQASLAFFPTDVSAGGNAERAAWLIHVYHDDSEKDWESVMERVSDFFQPYTDVILELDPDGLLGTRVADYIRANPEAFSDAALNTPPLKRPPNSRVAMS